MNSSAIVTPECQQGSSAAPIAPFRLFLTTLGPLLLICVSYYFNLNLEWKMIIGLIRSSIQLLFLGFILLGYIFSFNSPLVVFCYLAFMICIAALEATNRQLRTYAEHYWDCFLSCLIGGGCVGLYGCAVIFHPNPWWSAPVLIPTAGMIIGNSVSGPAVAVERLLSEVADKKHELETRLAFGASGYESVLNIIKASLQASLLPTMNQMAIMGLVSIPGMMTGQMLGGTSPSTAAEYQMAILYLIVTTAAITSFLAVFLAVKHAVFDSEHRLTPEKLIKKSGKTEIDQALLKIIRDNFNTVVNMISNCCVRTASVTATVTKKSSGSGAGYSQLSSSALDDLDSSRHPTLSPLQDDQNDDDIELARSTKKKSSSLHGSFTIHDDDEDDSNNNNDVQQLQQLFATHQPDDDNGNDNEVIGRVHPVIHTNIPHYHPIHPDMITASTPSSQLPSFLNLYRINVRSGDQFLFSKQGLTLVVRRGERITLEGPSGIGKTRLLRAIAQLDLNPFGGLSFCKTTVSISLAKSVTSLQVVTVPEWRKGVIYVPQALPPMAGSPYDLLMEACGYLSRKKTAGAKALFSGLSEHCARLEESLKLRAGLMTQAWNTLSGGERQRCAIACGLLLATINGRSKYVDKAVNKRSADEVEETKELPVAEEMKETQESFHLTTDDFVDTVILLDEPTAACDPETTIAVEKALIASGAAMMIITHDERQARRLAHRRILLEAIA